MISSAFAQSAAGGAGGFSLQGLLPFVLIFIIFYFLLIRPQQKKAKEHKILLDSIKRGDQILTSGGMIGKVIKADANELTVEISNNVNVRIFRSTVSDVLNKK